MSIANRTTNMASRSLLAVADVVEMQNSHIDGDGSDDDSEDEFDGYLDEDEVEQWLRQREMGGSGDEGNESGEEHDNSSENMDTEVPSIQPYTLKSGCSAPLSGNKPLDYFSLFVDQRMLQDIVDQTNLNSAQYIGSHTLAPHSRIWQWLKEEHNIAELRKFLALILVMGIVRYPQIESHWSTSWPCATDAFSSVRCIPYKYKRSIRTGIFLAGDETRSLFTTDEIPPPKR